MTSISIILATARNDYPMIGLPEDHIFQPTLDSLECQRFKDFELIISDCRFEKRPKCFEGKPLKREDYSFPIKHIPVKPNFWLERGMWTGPGTWNRGIVQADGELLLFIDDCSEFPTDKELDLFWKWYVEGFFASALCLYNKGGTPLYHGNEAKRIVAENQPPSHRASAENLDLIFDKGDRLKDSRWRFVERDVRGTYFFPGQSYYAYSSCSMESMLKINGWDENFDGDKTLGDVDVGVRLEQIGCKFVLDNRLTVIENVHGPIPKDTLWYEGNPVRSNYELMRMNMAAGRWKANSYRLTDEEAEHLRTFRHPGFGSNGQGRDMVPIQVPGTPEYALFQWWIKNPPMFDLRELWMGR